MNKPEEPRVRLPQGAGAIAWSLRIARNLAAILARRLMLTNTKVETLSAQ